ncbi:hypothetical protein TWF481_007773 [Arthrobotrys musiformis]|uniref:Uncharacterized protein n=1 Tax=Arthrobotrys musiformis TaxID=47236 RepID=A0AAV9WCG0_9PEZI
MSSTTVTHVVTGAAYPPAGRPVTSVLIMTTISVLTFCLTGDDNYFLEKVNTSAMVLGFGVNKSLAHCSAAIIMCIVFYETTKVGIPAHASNRGPAPTSKFAEKTNDITFGRFFGMLVPYVAICFLTLAFRFSYFDNGVCRIGMKKVALLPLITFDVVVNIAKAAPSIDMHNWGEPGWICLLLCNADILFSAVVLHTITNKDHQGSSETTRATNDHGSQNDTTILGNATEPGTRRSSAVKGRRPSVATNTGFIGPRLAPTYENDAPDLSSEKPASTSMEAGRKGSKAWLFGRSSRNNSTVTGLQFDVQPTSTAEEQMQMSQRARPEAPRRTSMAVNVGPIADYAEYDSDGLEFMTSAHIAEDLSSNGEGEKQNLSDEEVGGRRGEYEERVPHKLV